MLYRFNALLVALALIIVSGTSYAYEFSFKGMIKTELLYTDSGVASFGGGYSQVAPTNALRTDVFGGAPATDQQMRFLESDATSFQAAHSRFSLNMKHENVRTILEFDFIDGEDGFTNQTAIQAQGARLRLATLYYDVNESLTIFAGQKWTTAAGIKSNGSYNWIGNGYRAGNSGFLALEAGATYKSGGWTFTSALTNRGRNNSAAGINANELGSVPGFAVDLNYRTTASGHLFGFAGHIAEVNFEDEAGFASGSNQDANFFKAYTTLKFGSVSISAEAYTGEAVNNQNALGIAPATSLGGDGVVRESFSESGFFAFVNWDVKPGHNFKAGYATASVDEEDRLGLTELSANTAAYVNYGVKLTDSLTAFGQVTHFNTEFGVDFEDFSAVEARAGLLFRF
ncbi:MAG: hypothetical protein AAGL69_10690 [Pseudomonadota bacterium]